MKGIYGYYDTKNNEIVYIGKDSHIDKDRRKRQHLQASNAKAQPFNRALRNNPQRYIYKRLYECPPHLDNTDLNGLEMQYIEALNPKFNFTKGGDGVSGIKLSETHKQRIKENASRYWQGKSRSDETKRKISEKLKGRTPWNKGKKMTHYPQKKGAESPFWKDYARVIKRGKTGSGTPQYCLKYNGKFIKYSVDKEKLERLANDINNGCEI